MLVAVIVALMLMLFMAFKVSWFAAQLIGALTLISPRSLPLAVAEVVMATLLVFRLFDSVVAPMLLLVRVPVPEAIVKLVGSINQLPVLPLAAAVVIWAPSATFTLAALVSIAPPLPSLGALASMMPPTVTVPASIPAIKLITPL